MTESDQAPIDDTPVEELSEFPVLLSLAEQLIRHRKENVERDKHEAELVGRLLASWDQPEAAGRTPIRTGIKFTNGDAVRRVWSTSTSKIDPNRLREVLADAPNYIETIEVVKADELKKDYESVYRQLAKSKSKRTIRVSLKGE